MAQADLDRLVTSVDAATMAIDGFRQEIAGQNVFNERTRKQTRRLWLAYALIALLGLGLGVSVYRDHQTAQAAKAAADQAQRNAVNAEQVCLTGNVARATTRDLWEGLFKLPSIPPLTPAQQAAKDAQIATVRARIAVSYADQDCSKLGPQASPK